MVSRGKTKRTNERNYFIYDVELFETAKIGFCGEIFREITIIITREQFPAS